MMSTLPRFKRFSLTFIAAATIAGCQPSIRYTSIEPGTSFIPSISSHAVLKAKIDSLLAPPFFPPSSVGIKIVSIQTNETLYELNARNLFTPASNQKLLTSAAALKILGSDFSFVTSVGIDTSTTPVICVIGRGDPLIDTEDIDSLALQLSRVLPPGKVWTLRGDTSFFDDTYWGKGWMWDDEPDPTIPFISPLSINGNTITVHVSPSDTPFSPLIARLEPPTTIAQFGNTGLTVRDSIRTPLSITRRWREMSNVIDIAGEMRTYDAVETEVISIANPGLYFVDLLASRLRLHGIDVGDVELRKAPTTMHEVGSFTHSLDSVVVWMNKESDNLSAECIVKNIAAHTGEIPAKFETGIRRTKEALASMNVDTTQMVFADGSGVSRYNLLSPETIISVLTAMQRDSLLFPLFYASLPIAGTDGTLSNRLRNTPATNNLRAKTGTVTGVSSFSGYARTKDGELLAFSILMQGIPGRVRPYRQIQDTLGIILSGFSRKVDQ